MKRSLALATAGALLGPLPSLVFAQATQDNLTVLPEVQVTAQPATGAGEGPGYSPGTVLMGEALRQRSANSLGEMLGNEAGISSSGFGAASRPVIRGQEGARVRILQDGMSVQDVSTLSPDHAGGAAAGTARQVEVVRGPAALLYGSGITGGTVNVINERIPTELVGKPTGEAEVRAGSVDRSSNGSFTLDASAGKTGLHMDGSVLNAGDYRIPGSRIRNNPASGTGILPESFSHQQSIGLGASRIEDWGYAGLSLSGLNNRYGVPTLAGSRIDLQQQRLDFDALLRNPAPAFESVRLRAGFTDYRHSELNLANQPETNFSNKAWEARIEWRHRPLAGWRGRFGMQAEQARFAALNAGTGAPDTIQPTRSTAWAAFIAEERDFGPLNASASMRLESVARDPQAAIARHFLLGSASAGLAWKLAPQHRLGATYTSTQRAPNTEELYSSGPHDATGSFDRGQAGLGKENSRTLEMALEKSGGKLRWKASLFQSRISNFTFGRFTGALLDESGTPGGTLNERIFSQADATIHGAELEASYNAGAPGLSLRGFADTSRGRFDAAGNLPLQPATRIGLEAGYQQGPWRGGASVLHALAQQRIASFETTTPGWTRVDANLSWTGRSAGNEWTLFMLVRNLLDEDIRLASSLLKDVAPQPRRSLTLGIRTRF
ncbi:MAG: TonB-dependent receptor [Paucimonas sp.]|nr:TonB-dependent receptor [Paucimonas sp.]